MLLLVNRILSSSNKLEFNYQLYKKKIPKKCECGKIICKSAIHCKSCDGLLHRPRKVERPLKNLLHRMIWETSLSELGSKFGVSDNAIKKWCKVYKLTIPNSKYRGKLFAKTLIDYQI